MWMEGCERSIFRFFQNNFFICLLLNTLTLIAVQFTWQKEMIHSLHDCLNSFFFNVNCKQNWGFLQLAFSFMMVDSSPKVKSRFWDQTRMKTNSTFGQYVCLSVCLSPFPFYSLPFFFFKFLLSFCIKKYWAHYVIRPMPGTKYKETNKHILNVLNDF